MIKVYNDTKIFVHCPAGVVTGGAELLHQLVSILNDNGKDAYIVYFGEKDHVVPDDYKCYNIKLADSLDDTPHNIEIIWEGRFDFVRKYKKIQKLLWWLSVDLFYVCAVPYLSIWDIMKFNPTLAVKALIRRVGKAVIRRDATFLFHPVTIKELRNGNYLNCYQSEYAQYFLQRHGFKEMLPLKDYINTDHHFDKKVLAIKQDIVLYNPKKGYEFTKKLIKVAPEIKWVPLIGMRRNQLIETIKQAKVYIDFGYHPGKDRLPRECAVNGCCIITGYRGSAGFYEDVMIDHQYKFKDSTKEIGKIIKRIKWVFENYESAIDDFAYYRASIAREEPEFLEQIDHIFSESIIEG